MTRPRAAADLEVLHRDDDFVVVIKPAFLPTTGPGPEDTLVARVRALDPDAEKHHPSSRLDAEVTGVVTFARTSAAIQHLLAARRAGDYHRIYLGIAPRAPAPRDGEWHAAIGVDARDPRKRTVAADDDEDARESATRYRTLAELAHAALLALEPQTGRTHQLRVHAAHAGCALLGDRPYGGPTRIVLSDGSVVTPRRVMLHCTRVTIPNPRGGPALSFEARPPADMQRLWESLGGGPIAVP